MNKTRRTISLILALAMIIGLVPCAFSASAEAIKDKIISDGTLTYRVISENRKTVEVEKLLSSTITELQIPDTVQGYTVKRIDSYAFDGYAYSYNSDTGYYENETFANLELIRVPGTVTIIDDYAFRYNYYKYDEQGNRTYSKLTTIVLPKSIKYIGRFAFEDCKNLANIAIPSSLKRLGYGAFLGCERLTSIALPEGITCIESCTFSDCKGLTSVTIPSTVKAIEYSAFSDCESLTNVTVPSGVEFIGECAFDDCDKLTSVKILSLTADISPVAFGYYNKLIKKAESGDSEDDEYDYYAKVDNFSISAYAGSSAEAYAKDNGFAFVAIPKSGAKITAKAVKKTYKVKALKKAKSFKLSAKVNSGSAITFKKTKGNKKITVTKAGKVTVKKGIKKGTYKVKVKISSAATDTFNAGSKTITLKIIIKK